MKLLKLFLITILSVNQVCSASHRGLLNPPPHNPNNLRPDPNAIAREHEREIGREQGREEAQCCAFVHGVLITYAALLIATWGIEEGYITDDNSVTENNTQTMQKYLAQWYQEGFAQDETCRSMLPQETVVLEGMQEYVMKQGKRSCKKLQTQLKFKSVKTATCPRKAAPFVKSKPRKCTQNYR